MPRLAIDKDFLDDYSKLEKSVQNAVKSAIDKFAEHTYAGLHLEKIQNSVDDRIRTIRIDAFWRGVVLAPDSGDTYCLIKVMPHDKAIDYAASHRFTVNQALGVVEVRNEVALEQIQPSLATGRNGRRQAVRPRQRRRPDPPRHRRQHAHRPAAHFRGASGRAADMIPEAQYNALYALAGGLTVEEVWRRSRSIAARRTRRHQQRRHGHGAHPEPRGLRRATTNSSASWSTRSRPGGSSCIRRSGRSPTRPGTQVRLR